MPVTINGTTGIAGVDGSAGTPAVQGTDTNTGVYFPTADTISASTGGTERMRIDSSGNVGIGVTPSAWSGLTVLQIKGASLYSSTRELGSQSNAYYNAGWKYIDTAAASQYLQSAGIHYWYTAASGTAGSAITFTERMRIDDSGRVLIGTTSAASGYVLQPYGKIYAGDDTNVTPDAFWSGQLTIRGNAYAGGLSLDATGMWVGHNSSARALLFATDETERMRIDTSGNVGIGTTSPSSYASANDKVLAIKNVDQVLTFGAYYQSGVGQAGFINSSNSNNSGSAQPLSFRTGNVERMRIDTSGNVLVTSSGGLGYGTGSGGTVTQATSKSTTVTLNKANGNVTTHNSALAAGASVEFSVTNSSVAVTDTVILSGIWGVSANYRIELKGVYGGGFAVRITNITAGSLSEAIGINFAVIKATTS